MRISLLPLVVVEGARYGKLISGLLVMGFDILCAQDIAHRHVKL